MKLGRMLARPGLSSRPSPHDLAGDPHDLAGERSARVRHVRRVLLPWGDMGRHRVIETVGLLRAEAFERTPRPPGVR